MKQSLPVWQTVGFLFTGIAGVLLHFLFDWSGGSPFVAPFSAVNESIWEHMKLLFFPMFLFALLQSWFIGKDYESFWCVKLIGILTGVILIPVLYYTINGIFGTTPDRVNIIIFFITDAIVYLLETRLLSKDSVRCIFPRLGVLLLCFLALLFIVLTFYPPVLPLFLDPLSRTYGYFMN